MSVENGVSPKRPDVPIAIVGMGCRFPGEATSPEKLWQLCASARSAWSEVPPERWNRDAFHHPDGGRIGTTNVSGGHFLSQDIARFDATFFNVSAEEAKAMDPQLRLQLEVCYEALENAGIPLAKIAGTNTAVFSGIFTKDYAEGMLRDVETLPRYYVTGTGTAMLANRVSYFFDLNGPSMTVDTGCSTSLVALHLACQSIRAGESEGALVGGSSIILNPDLPIALSNMGFLSSEGRSYAFDHRASGYGRGEGAACIVIKPLEKALRDGDYIHSVIRQTAVNSDGKTDGITQPSGEAHERLIRYAYNQVNLDPFETDYVEAHGTGTQVGDPLELKAISAVFGSTRTERNPVYVGTVKTNVGHLEAASGLAGMIKASLALQKGIIPPNINFERVSEKISLQTYNLKIPLEQTPWPSSEGPRRVSVISLGYGGTNAHVILENVKTLINPPNQFSKKTRHGITNGFVHGSTYTNGSIHGLTDSNGSGHGLFDQSAHKLANEILYEHSNEFVDESANGYVHEHTKRCVHKLAEGSVHENANGGVHEHMNGQSEQSSNRWRIYTFSAKDEEAVYDMIDNTCSYLETRRALMDEAFLDNLVYTLGQRRSSFRWVQAFAANSADCLMTALRDRSRMSTRRAEARRIGFVFTGQGAQWHAMGRELLDTYPVFRGTMHQADDFLKRQRCPWSLIEELNRDEKSTKVNTAAIGQPLCTAIQIGLVKLLESWNIRPIAVIGHSSGEIAAAYAAGAIGLESAMMAAYYRGTIVQKSVKLNSIQGGMIAIGLSRNSTMDYIQRLTSGKVVVACVNSPSNVTVSGDSAAIEELQTLLDAEGVFARRLRVNIAYHSHHMLLAVDGYLEQLQDMQTEDQLSDVLYVSSVTGQPISSAKALGPSYWAENAVQPVLFSDALMCLCRGGSSENTQDVKAFVDTLIEIGPHGALAAPIRQILQAPSLQNMQISYLSCLTRNQDACESVQAMASALLLKDSQINIGEINFPKGNSTVKVIADLPSYPWSHKTRYWHEPRISRQQRQRLHGRHDLLGVLSPGQNPFAKTWRHFVRLSDQPWIKDHVVDSNILYPAAGFIAMAIEAVSQTHNNLALETVGYLIHEMTIMNALVVPETSDGVETQLSLFPSNELLRAQHSYGFKILSVDENDEWHEHCTGRVGLEIKSVVNESNWKPHSIGSRQGLAFSMNEQSCARAIDKKHYYESIRRLGISYGESFQNLVQIKQGPSRSFAAVAIRDTAALMPAQVEHPYIIHPTTLDAIFQSIYPAISETGTEHKHIMVPTFVKSLFVSQKISSNPGSRLRISTSAEFKTDHEAKASLTVIDETDLNFTPVVEIDGLVLSSIGASVEELKNERGELCFKVSFDKDISFMTPSDFSTLSERSMDPSESKVTVDLQRACFYIVERALKKLTDTDRSTFAGHQLAMFEWMMTQHELGQQGRLDSQDSTWLDSSDEEQDRLIAAIESETINGQMCVRIGKYLVQILRKETEPLEVMMEGGLLYSYYENSLGLKRIYAHMSGILRLFAHKNPGSTILEIGGGTGGCTLPALRALTGDDDGIPRFAHYDFTDISSGFFAKAREKLIEWEDRLSFKKFDVEVDAESQGIDCGKYDLVIACIVLHATVSKEKTLRNVRRLLRPGGRLLVVEVTRDTLDVSLVFGVLPGWWLGQEEEHRLSPNLSIAAWDDLLKRTGFTGMQALMLDAPVERDHVHSIFLSSTSLDTRQKEYPPTSIVFGQHKPPHDWLEVLSSSLESVTGHVPALASLDEAELGGNVCIFVAEMTKPVLSELGQEGFLALRKMLTSAKGVLWITTGGTLECSNPKAGMVTGLMRTLRNENVGIRYATLDQDSTRQPYTTEAAGTISKVFEATFNFEYKSINVDLEYTERNNQIFIPRFLPDPGTNRAIIQDSGRPVVEEQRFHQEDRPLRMEMGTAGLLDTLRFVDDLDFAKPLPDDCVEVAPKAFGLNFRDIMVAMGQLNETIMGYECAGIITRVGSKITHLKVGDRVAAMMRGHYANYIRLLGIAVAKVPDDIAFEQATSMPLVFCTAYFSLYDTARLQKGETVLIHAAAGGVGQAAIMLAQLVGAEVYATVGSKEKCQFLIDTYGIPENHIFSSRNALFASEIMVATNGKGVDVALNCLSGQLLKATWTCMAMFGRLIEIGKRDIEINSHLDMSGFQGNVSFSAIDLTYMSRFRPAHLSSILEKCMKLASEGRIHAVKPITVYSMSEIERAFRFMQAGKHTGKVVIRPSEGDLVKVLARRARDLFRNDSSYIVVGGLGGLGQSLVRWMIKHGAKNLIILSRSGKRHVHADELLGDLDQAGCRVIMPECDITDGALVRRILNDSAKSMPPIRGVIQGAMVLNDCVFERMLFEQYQNAVLPKVQGTWNLHTALSEHDLDFFIMLSSIVGIVGNSSQANYGAGSSFLDALAHHCRSLGLSAVCIDLGIIDSVGYVAENEAVAKRFARLGHDFISEEKMVGLIQLAIANGRQNRRPEQIVTGLNTRELEASWIQDSKFSILRSSRLSGASSASHGRRGANAPKSSLQDHLSAVKSVEDATTVICEAIISKLANNLMVSDVDIDPEQPISACGVDSLVAVELRNWLLGQTTAEISVIDVLQSKSIVALSQGVARKSKAVARVVDAG